jgi:hypothetical protein
MQIKKKLKRTKCVSELVLNYTRSSATHLPHKVRPHHTSQSHMWKILTRIKNTLVIYLKDCEPRLTWKNINLYETHCISKKKKKNIESLKTHSIFEQHSTFTNLVCNDAEQRDNFQFPHFKWRTTGKIKTTMTIPKHKKKTPWSESASELYRPSNRRLSTKWLPTFAVRGCHMVSVTDPYGCILSFLDRSCYFSSK